METIRVLAVAHDETTLRLCLLGLGVEGMEVHHATDLESAIETAERHQPHVAVVDTTIPTGPGLTVLRGLVGGIGTAGIPVITLVDGSDPGARMAHWIAGAASTIAKPFSLDELSHTVRRFGRMSVDGLQDFRYDLIERLRELDPSGSPN